MLNILLIVLIISILWPVILRNLIGLAAPDWKELPRHPHSDAVYTYDYFELPLVQKFILDLAGGPLWWLSVIIYNWISNQLMRLKKLLELIGDPNV